MKKTAWLIGSLLTVLTIHLGEQSALAFGPKNPKPEVRTVPYVDLNRYLGRWYEISSFPQRFAKGCTATRATYTAVKEGRIEVLNECHLNSLDGELKQAQGYAKVVDTESNSKLKVTFFWPFFGDYWIIDLGANYDYAVVGSPDREYLWVLSRNTTMDETTYQEILSRAQAQGFDVTRLVKMLQP